MPTTAKVLGQTGDASSEVDLYTVPSATISKFKVIVVNRDTSDATFTIAVVPDGGVTGDANYIAFNEPIIGSHSVTSTTLTADAADVIRVQSSTSMVSFSAIGLEQS